MAQIVVEIDPTLKKRTIEMPLLASSEEEAGEDAPRNQNDVMQTSVFGILVPLIKINNTIIDFDKIDEFELSSEGPLPTLQLSFEDTFNLIENFSTPSNDNFILVQILPPFDEAYKKINLEFYISNIDINDTYISLMGIYKVPSLLSSNFKSLGQIDTHELCKKIATETGLGFASNVSGCSDKRWVYCNHMSYKDLLDSEIKRSGGQSTEIFDWWVDFWDYINLVNIYERYNSVDEGDDMKVWIGDQQKNIVDTSNKIIPYQVHCALTNNPAYQGSDLSIASYSISNNSGMQATSGTDKVYSVYGKNLGEYKDTLMQDGDVQHDVFQKYEYIGECEGDYNYLLAGKLREAYIQKMNTETLEVVLSSPMLGIHRGSKVDVVIYDNSTMLDISKRTIAAAKAGNPPTSNVPVSDESPEESDSENNQNLNGSFTVKQNLSGQYYVLKQNLIYSNGEWSNVLILSRPTDSKYDPLQSELMKEEEEKNAAMRPRDNVEGLRALATQALNNQTE